MLIVDDHAIVRDGIRALLALAEDMAVVGEAGGGREAIELARRLSPDVIVMDIAMPDLGGLEATLEIRKDTAGRQDRRPQPVRRCVIRAALSAGRRLGLRAQESGRRRSRRGDSVGRTAAAWCSIPRSRATRVTGDAVSRPAPARRRGDDYERLTDREKQVLKLVAEGRSNKEVAALLGISVKTAMSHREHVMEKLGAHNRTDLDQVRAAPWRDPRRPVTAAQPNCTSIAMPMNGRNIAKAPPITGATTSSTGQGTRRYVVASSPGSVPPSAGTSSTPHVPRFQ